MLASLLPGLRDLRAPLASGYLWLAFAWACFSSQLTDAVQRNDPVHELVVETGVLGPTRLLAILTFVAFLIGAVCNVSSRRFATLVIWYWDPVWERTVGRAYGKVHRKVNFGAPQARTSRAGGAQRRTPARETTPDTDHLKGTAIGGLHVSTIAHRHLLTFLRSRPGGAAAVPPEAELDDPRLRERTRPVYDEIPQLAIRLAKDQPTLFDAYDRAHAEADFRVTVAFPLAALGVRLMWIWWPAGVLLIAGSPFMLAAAMTKEREANDVVIEAVCIDAVQSEAVNRLLGVTSNAQRGRSLSGVRRRRASTTESVSSFNRRRPAS
jgi:hypothetical protein